MKNEKDFYSMNQHILMLCHDQYLDRRVVAQAQSLAQLGHQVTLCCLSHNKDDDEEYLPEGIHLIRIGLKNIIPDNKLYKKYVVRNNILHHLLNQTCGKIIYQILSNVSHKSALICMLNFLSNVLHSLFLLYMIRCFSLCD